MKLPMELFDMDFTNKVDYLLVYAFLDFDIRFLQSFRLMEGRYVMEHSAIRLV